MAERDRNLDLRSTPGGVIAATAFNYAVTFHDFAALKFPELKQRPPDERITSHQAGIIVATLILLEKRGAGSEELRDGVSRAFPPSARRRCLAAVQELSSALLRTERAGIAPEAVPSYAPLAGTDDKELASAIGSWLALSVLKKRALEPAELPLAAAMGRSAWTSAVMIARILQKKKA